MEERDRDRPISTADIAGTEPGREPTAPEGAGDTTAMPTQQQLDEEPQTGDVSLTGRAEGTPGGGSPAAATGTAGTAPLLSDQDTTGYRGRWEAIQAGFVDQPRRSVEEADALVAEVMQQLARTFQQTRQDLEGQWAGGGEAGTEELRVALQRYRSFFEVLLRR